MAITQDPTGLTVSTGSGSSVPILIIKNTSGQIRELLYRGNPEGFLTGAIGDRVTDLNSGKVYVKQTASGSFGWVVLSLSNAIFYNVKDYGAVGNGSTNDTTAIQNCINAATSANGRAVYFPAGTYLVTGLNITGRYLLFGDGDKQTIIKSTSNAPILNVTGSGFKGSTIRDMLILGSVTSGTNQIGIKVTDNPYSYGYRFSNLSIQSCGGQGLFVGKVYSSSFEDIYIDDCAGYGLVYDAANMPKNWFKNIYVGNVRDTAKAAFRIKAGEFIAENCNGINNVITGTICAVVGRKNGVDGDVANETAIAHWTNCNFEAYALTGVHHYYNSRSYFKGLCTFTGASYGLSGNINNTQTTIALVGIVGLPTSGKVQIENETISYTGLSGNSLTGCTRGADGTTAAAHNASGITVYNKSIKPVVYEVDSALYPAYFPRGIMEDGTLFADGPEINYANNSAVHCNDVPPLQIAGKGPIINPGNGALPLSSYYNSGTAKIEMLSRADSFVRRVSVTGTTSFTAPGIRYIEVNSNSACTITLPWAGWYRVQEPIIIKDVGNKAGQYAITINSAGGGTVNGSTYILNQNGQSVTVIPNETDYDWKVVDSHTPAISSATVNITYASTVAVNWASGDVQAITLTGNWTPSAFSNIRDGARYVLRIKQDGSGSKTITWPAIIKWAGGSAPVLTTTANKTDVFSFVSDGTNLFEVSRALNQ